MRVARILDQPKVTQATTNYPLEYLYPRSPP